MIIYKWIVSASSFDLPIGSYILITFSVNYTIPARGSYGFYGGSYWNNAEYDKMEYLHIAGTDISSQITNTLNPDHKSYKITVNAINSNYYFFKIKD